MYGRFHWFSHCCPSTMLRFNWIAVLVSILITKRPSTTGHSVETDCPPLSNWSIAKLSYISPYCIETFPAPHVILTRHHSYITSARYTAYLCFSRNLTVDLRMKGDIY